MRIMSKDELLKALDLKGHGDDPKESSFDCIITPVSEESKGPAEPTALAHDKWSLRRGEEVASELPAFERLGLDELEAADCFAAAFEPAPELVERCEDELRQQYFETLLETPDYQALHQQTQCDSLASEIASVNFAEGWARVKESQQDGGSDSGTGTKTKKKDPRDSVIGGVAQALEKAKEEVKELQDAKDGLGLGPGAPGANDTKAISNVFKRVRNSDTLHKILAKVSSFKFLAASQQRKKALHGMDDVVGVTLGDNLGAVLPHELGQLADPDLEDDVLRRLTEKQLMMREYRAVEPQGKGPVVVVVDESGSMCGDKVHTAKALALAMTWLARQQKRWCALIAFSGGTEGRLLTLPPGRWDEEALCDWLEAFLGGGTCCDVPLVELPNRYWIEMKVPQGKTDILCITDAIVYVPEEVKENFLRWKQQESVRLYTIVIEEEPGDMAAVSDEVYKVPAITANEEAVAKVLSI